MPDLRTSTPTPRRLAALLLMTLPAFGAAQQPNILLLIADDYGVDQSRIYTESAAAPTPNLEALAARGLAFERLWSAPWCSPTRATLLSGQHGFRNGVLWVVIGEATSPAIGLTSQQLEAPHYLPKLLNQQGYDTGLIGKWHLSKNHADGPIQAGFDFWAGTLRSFGSGDGAPADNLAPFWGTNLPVFQCSGTSCAEVEFPPPPVAHPIPAEFNGNYRTTWEVDRALEWLAERENPWFLWMAFQSAHTPLQLPPEHLVDEELAARISSRLGAYEAGYWAKLGEDKELEQLVYHAMVSSLDTEIGRLLDAVVLDNTYVIFIGDNGTIARVADPALIAPDQGKGTFFESGINVPFVIAGPDQPNPGTRSAALVHTSDIYSTVLGLAGADINEDGFPAAAVQTAQIDGRSLLPLIFDGAETVYDRQHVLNNVAMYPYVNPVLTTPGEGTPLSPLVEREVIRDRQYKLHRKTLQNEATGFSCLAGPQPSMDNPVPCGLTERVKAFELYDLAADPRESNNLLADGEEGLSEQQREAFHRLRDALIENFY